MSAERNRRLSREGPAAFFTFNPFPTMPNNPKYAYGIDGLAEIFGCSKSTAKRIKAGGTINKAIAQQGRTIVIDVDLAIALFGARNSRQF